MADETHIHFFSFLEPSLQQLPNILFVFGALSSLSLLGPGNQEDHKPNTFAKLGFGQVHEILLSLRKLSASLAEKTVPKISSALGVSATQRTETESWGKSC